MDWKERIVINPDILVGKPVIKGTRIAVEFILELLANGWTHEEIMKNYPQLKEDDIMSALKYAAFTLKTDSADGHRGKNLYVIASEAKQSLVFGQ